MLNRLKYESLPRKNWKCYFWELCCLACQICNPPPPLYRSPSPRTLADKLTEPSLLLRCRPQRREPAGGRLRWGEAPAGLHTTENSRASPLGGEALRYFQNTPSQQWLRLQNTRQVSWKQFLRRYSERTKSIYLPM